MKTLIVFLALSILAGCGQCTSCSTQPVKAKLQDSALAGSAPWIQKTNQVLLNGNETTPVVLNGLLLFVSCPRNAAGVGSGIDVYREDLTVLGHLDAQIGFCSAIVDEGMLWVFGTTDSSSHGNRIVSFSTEDLQTWSEEHTLLTAGSNEAFFNTSVSVDATQFVMAYEVCSSGQVCYHFRFAKSQDLVNWTRTGGEFGGDHYSACPTIRYSNGYYYAFYLGDWGGVYATKISRSSDLVNWEDSKTVVLSPLDSGDSGENASDMDLVEYGDELLIVYGNGSQTGKIYPNTGTRIATYQGTLNEFVLEFFK